mmetsp:Transcript_5508/g.11973  ORF Transcript_5508/g.11973 Transcript_5508/m.11973 type:complete len:385 (+) Transcript_5508:171-1325(+)
MSVCANHFRRALGSSSAAAAVRSTRLCMGTTTLKASLSSIPALSSAAASVSVFSSEHASSISSSNTTIRQFAAAAKKSKSKKDSNDQNGLSYKERKDAAKQKRREAWQKKHDRIDRLATRRDHSPKDVLKTQFRSWWDKEVMYHDVLRRAAKKENKPWRIRVAVMVERLPVVTPDMEDWERDYIDLRDYIWTYGKEYPEETGFMYAPDKPEDHIVPTDEELLAGLPFQIAPRETEADATGNVKTRDRQLKTRVYLAHRTDAEGNKSGPRWTLPSALASNDETLLQTAQRAVSASFGKDLELWCPSNAPMTVNFRVYNKNLPESFREGYYGEKIFYYRVQHDQGDVDESSLGNGEDYAWLTREEMVERVEEERGKHQAKFFHYML